MAVLFYLSDNLLELNSLQDILTSAAITGATVEVTLVDKQTGNEVVGQSWPTSMTHDVAGTYRATLVDTLTVALHDELEAQITADDGANRRLAIFLPVTIEKKTGV